MVRSQAKVSEAAAKPVAETKAAKTVAEVKASLEKTEKKAPAKKTEKPAVKAAAKKADADTKAKRKKKKIDKTTMALRKDPIQESYFEIDGEQIMVEDTVKKIKEAYKNEGHRIGTITSLKTYFNFAERRAYYVINDNEEGKYVDF
ncbi:MAG: DUF6465 family protein [Lachnospiraceae bacterium]|jgi:hypothetical protein|nr:DUF6465 family protein [Lachnospiraceae bacterium]MEE3461638.1 DUF6465 family protein [Lachnospiraceae bacterium]